MQADSSSPTSRARWNGNDPISLDLADPPLRYNQFFTKRQLANDVAKVSGSIKLIEHACSKGYMRPLAAYFMLKSLYRTSCIYNYRKRMDELSVLLGMSAKTLYKYLDILRDHGLIDDHCDNLVICSMKRIKHRLKDYRKLTLRISTTDTVKTIENKLFVKILENHSRKLAYREALRRFGIREGSKRESFENEFLPSLSLRTIAKVLNISTPKAHKLIKELNDAGIIKSTPQRPIYVKKWQANIDILDDYPGHKFKVGDILFVQFGMRHKFEFEVILPKITLKAYIKHYRSTHCK